MRRFAFYSVAVALAQPEVIAERREQAENRSVETYKARCRRESVTDPGEVAAVKAYHTELRRSAAGRKVLALADKIRADARQMQANWDSQQYTFHRGNPQ